MKLTTLFIFSSLFVLSSTILLKSNNFEDFNMDYLKKIEMFAIQLRQTYTLLYKKMFHSNYIIDQTYDDNTFKTKEEVIKKINKEMSTIAKIKKMIIHNEDNELLKVVQNEKLIDDLSITDLDRMIKEFKNKKTLAEKNYRFTQEENKEQSLFDYLFGNTI